MSELFAGSRYDSNLSNLVDNDSSYDKEEEKEYGREEDTVNCNVSVAVGDDTQSVLEMAVFDVERNPLFEEQADDDEGTEGTENVEENAITDEFIVLYANVRGLSQVAAQLRDRANALKHALIVLTETHLNGDAVEAKMLPPEYMVSARKDRTQHGGGVMIMSADHILVNELDMSNFYEAETAEIIGVEFGGYHMFDGYTQNSKSAPKMFEQFKRIKQSEAFSGKRSMFCCDANAHSEEFLDSEHTDLGGKCAQHFSELFDMKQCVDFPTRENNILDLIYCDTSCSTSSLPHLRTSDHLTIIARVSIDFKFPDPPAGKASVHWRTAPWDNMRGHLDTQFKERDARVVGGVDDAVSDYYRIIDGTVEKYVQKSRRVITIF